MTKRKLAAIIPYYQRDPGILRRALDSIFAQTLPLGLTVHVFIVDDASPCPPEPEVEGLPPDGPVSFSIHRQANGGPGAARNTGLDLAEADGGFDFVAFLDSDDEWLPPHLADAIAALELGYDFYFCDNGRDGVYDLYSDEVVALQDSGTKLLNKAARLKNDPLLLGFAPFALNAEMVENCLCHTSAVVLRESMILGRRFDPDLRTAGEDWLFWVSRTLSGAKIAISWRCNVVCGRGVNIFFASFDWNSPATLNRIGYMALFSEKLARLPGLMPESRMVASVLRRKYQRAYAFLFMRTVLRRSMPSTNIFAKISRLDPLFPLKLPALFLRVALDRRPEARKW